ncbi:hypothetical protein ACTQ5R_09645 [Ruoffia tabacinasalis]|uniref:hypothetical protein n=1 Tax=Ruoffia tabacinasalis TaxID=87458 RepID=UPI003F9E1E78
MYIKKIELLENSPEIKLINDFHFKNHLNLIVDGSIDLKRGNGVGKTTILRLVDICLGSRDKKFLYTDYETGIVETSLKNYIEENEISVKLTVVDSLEQTENSFSLERGLFDRAGSFINGEKYNQEEYKEELNKIFFKNDLNTPSFRHLIKKFVRIDFKSDNDKFLKFLHNTTSKVEYESIYNYLFELRDNVINQTLLSLKEELKKIDNNQIKLKELHNYESIEQLERSMTALMLQNENIQNEINKLVNSEYFIENEEEIKKIRIKYANLNNELDNKSYNLQRIDNILQEAKSEQEDSIDNEMLGKLYNDAEKNISELKKTFDDLVRFNNELNSNKIKYYMQLKEKTTKELNILAEKKEELFKSHQGVITLIENDVIDKYYNLQNRLGDSQEKLGEYKNILSIHDELNSKYNATTTKIDEIESGDNYNSTNIDIFNKYFSQYSENINSEPYILYETNEGFPFNIKTVSGKGLSTGNRKSLISAFDLAYQSFSEEINKKTPNFIIHDVVESIDSQALEKIIETVHDTDSQYILAVLSEKLDGIEGISEDDIVVTLTEENRPFKI